MYRIHTVYRFSYILRRGGNTDSRDGVNTPKTDDTRGHELILRRWNNFLSVDVDLAASPLVSLNSSCRRLASCVSHTTCGNCSPSLCDLLKDNSNELVTRKISNVLDICFASCTRLHLSRMQLASNSKHIVLRCILRTNTLYMDITSRVQA